jgi:hypothetical protein
LAIQQKTQNGMTGPGRPPKQRDKTEGNVVKEDGQMENGRKMDMERGQPPPTENGGDHHRGDNNNNNSAEVGLGNMNNEEN